MHFGSMRSLIPYRKSDNSEAHSAWLIRGSPADNIFIFKDVYVYVCSPESFWKDTQGIDDIVISKNETGWLIGVKREFSVNIPLCFLNFERYEYIAYLKIK